jgi:hypothetical protein
MLFDDEFLAALLNDPLQGAIMVCDLAAKQVGSGNEWSDEDHEALGEAFTLIVELNNAGLIVLDMFIPGLSTNLAQDCATMQKFLETVSAKLAANRALTRVEGHTKRFRAALSRGLSYEFTQGDLDRIQELIAELREQISKSELLEEGHRARLLRRLETLQSEIHKKMSDLDRLWGFLGDLGVVMGKFGNDVKPIVDRMKELLQITWTTQARAEELQTGAGFPQLGNDTSDKPS